MGNPHSRIIWSADVLDEEALTSPNAEELAERALWSHLAGMPDLEIVKLDRALMEGCDLDLIARVHGDFGVNVFDDAKIIEIGPKVVLIAAKHLKRRPWMFNIMAGSWTSNVMKHPKPEFIDGLKRFADACHAVGTRPCGVTVLSTKTPEVVDAEFNGRTAIEQVLIYVARLKECGFTDIVCAAKEVAAIRTATEFDDIWLNPAGVRPAGSELDDQVRADTPEAVLRAGRVRTRMVIGRPITEGNPALNLRNIADSIAHLV